MALGGQSAFEFLAVYGFAILIITIAIALVLIISSSSTSTLPEQCSFSGGFNCIDVVYGISGTSSRILLQASFTQPGQINITNFSVRINPSQSYNGYCTPNVASQGEKVYCTADFALLPKPGNTYTGTLAVKANYCAGPSSSLYNYSCISGGNFSYQGAFQTQAVSQQLPSGPYYYAPITLTNSNATTATVAGLQAMVGLVPSKYASYERADLGNIRFYDGAKELRSWCEFNCSSSKTSNAIFWVALDRQIPPDGSVSLNAYFLPNSIGFDCIYAGESPLQSNTYAQCDNGGQVFNFYDNFAGNTLNSSLWNNQCATEGNTCIVNNGLSVSTASSGNSAAIFSKAMFGGGVVDIYWANVVSNLGTSQSYCLGGAGLANATYPELNSAFMGYVCGTTIGLQTSTSLGITSRASDFNSGAKIFSIYVPSASPSSVTLAINYTISRVTINTNMPTLPQPIVVAMQTGVSFLSPTTLQIGYIRIRYYPPGGVLPGFSAGSAVQVPQ